MGWDRMGALTVPERVGRERAQEIERGRACKRDGRDKGKEERGA